MNDNKLFGRARVTNLETSTLNLNESETGNTGSLQKQLNENGSVNNNPRRKKKKARTKKNQYLVSQS